MLQASSGRVSHTLVCLKFEKYLNLYSFVPSDVSFRIYQSFLILSEF